MDADEHRLGPGYIPFDQGQVLGVLGLVNVDDGPEPAAGDGIELKLEPALDDGVVTPPVGDEIGDGGDFHAVTLGERRQVREPGHGAVVVHDLADHARRVEAGEAGDVDRRFRMARADEHTPVARHQGEHVAGGDDIVLALRRVDGDRHGPRPVGRGNSCGNPLASVDRDGEGGLVTGQILACHQRQAELPHPLARQRQADQASAVLGHEVDRLGTRQLGRDQQVSLVLALLLVHKDHHLALPGVLENLFDGREVGGGGQGYSASLRRAT